MINNKKIFDNYGIITIPFPIKTRCFKELKIPKKNCVLFYGIHTTGNKMNSDDWKHFKNFKK